MHSCSLTRHPLWQVVYLEGWMMEVTPFLVATITDGTIGDECLVAALQTLTNLCRSNPPVMECLRRCPNIKVRQHKKSLLQCMSQVSLWKGVQCDDAECWPHSLMFLVDVNNIRVGLSDS